MKYVVYQVSYYLICVLLSCLIIGCDGNISNVEDQMELNSPVTLIRFKDPTDKNYILAHYYQPKKGQSSGEFINMMRFNKCIFYPPYTNTNTTAWDFHFPESHHPAYWELPDGWLLIDWRWQGVPYNKNNAVTLDLQWEELYNVDWSWSINMVRHKNPLVECIFIDLYDLQVYLEKKYSAETLSLVNQVVFSGSFVKDFSKKGYCLCEIPDKLDAVWNEIQSDLSFIIENGNIEKVPHLEFIANFL